MRIVLFVHSLVSDWNHGNAHFLRGLVRALQARGHEVLACERWRSWSVDGLIESQGHLPIVEFARVYPDLRIRTYGSGDGLADEVAEIVRGADLVLVHEFNDPLLVGLLGEIRRRHDDFVLLFHDTHHRAVSAPAEIAALDLGRYDGVLAFGASLAQVYRTRFGQRNVWTFHEAADTTLFHPRDEPLQDDVVWIGNWGDGERSEELGSYLIDSARLLSELRFVVHGVRYPDSGLARMRAAGIEFRGWLPNYRVPEVFARAKLTLHIPRGPYLNLLPGIPTIRPFEALACGIPLLSTWWPDTEGLFHPGHDHLVVHSAVEMREQILRLCRDAEARGRLRENGLATIRAAHTCDHRAEQLLGIRAELAGSLSTPRSS